MFNGFPFPFISSAAIENMELSSRSNASFVEEIRELEQEQEHLEDIHCEFINCVIRRMDDVDNVPSSISGKNLRTTKRKQMIWMSGTIGVVVPAGMDEDIS